MKWIRKVWPYVTILILAYWSFAPLASPGFFPVHDDTQVARVYEMAKAIRDGQFPVRWVEDLGYGYGYPLFNFYAPLPYYFGGLFNLLGLDAMTATKLMFLAGILLATFSMYALGRELYGVWGGLLSAVFYTYAPYRALDIYVRGAVGEYWAMAFLPFLVLGIYRLVSFEREKRDRKRRAAWVLFTALSWMSIILSHNITAMIVGIVLAGFVLLRLLYCLLNRRSTSAINAVFAALLLGLGLAAFFWLPAILENQYTSVAQLTTGGSRYQDHFVYPDQLWDSPWGYGGSAVGYADGLSFKIGRLSLVAASLSVLFALGKRQQKNKGLVLVFLALAAASIFMSLDVSKPVWDLFPFMSFVQFPWRFLLFTTMAISLLGGALYLSISRFKIGFFVGLCFLTILYNSKYFVPKWIEDKPSTQYTEKKELQWRVSKVSDEYLPLTFIRPQSTNEIRGDRIVETSGLDVQMVLTKTSNNLLFTGKNDRDQEVVLALTSFPGWMVTVNGSVVNTISKNGRIAFGLRPGRYTIEAVFQDTPVRSRANTISYLSALLFMLLLVYAKNQTAS